MTLFFKCEPTVLEDGDQFVPLEAAGGSTPLAIWRGDTRITPGTLRVADLAIPVVGDENIRLVISIIAGCRGLDFTESHGAFTFRKPTN